MKDFDSSKLTSEQREQMQKVFKDASKSILFIALKFAVLTVITNTASTVLALLVLRDLQPDTIQHFLFICAIINLLFMTGYLGRQLKANDGIVNSKIDKILKNNQQ